MQHAERRRLVQWLRAQGQSIAAIAQALQVGYAAVAADLVDEELYRGESLAALERAHMEPCPDDERRDWVRREIRAWAARRERRAEEEQSR